MRRNVFLASLSLLFCGCADRIASPLPKPGAQALEQSFSTCHLVIIKADDLKHAWGNPNALHPRWVEFARLIEELGVKAALDVEGWSLDSGREGYFRAVRSLVASKRFEVFNHGYTHSSEGTDPAWKAPAEFKGRPAGSRATTWHGPSG